MKLLNHFKITINKNRSFPTIINVICLVLLITILVQMVHGLVVTDIKITNFTKTNLPQHVVRLADWHLFGVYDARASLLPKTRLPLILEGTMVATDKVETSHALISAAGHTKIYKMGQTVPGGATIKKIKHNNIVLSVHGQLESLEIPVPKLASNKLY